MSEMTRVSAVGPGTPSMAVPSKMSVGMAALPEQRAIEVSGGVGHRGHGEALADAAPARLREPLAERSIVQDPGDGGGQRRRIARRHQEPGDAVLDGLAVAADARGH